MQKIFPDPSEIEKTAKAQYGIPQFLMMENAARALADFVLDFEPEKVLMAATVMPLQDSFRINTRSVC